MPPSAVAQHPLDEISLGLIVQIRERLLKAQAAGKKVYRLESGGWSDVRKAWYRLDGVIWWMM